jgi:hypothetical protein
MENRSNTPGRVFKAIISKYIYSLDEEQPEMEKYFIHPASSTHCRVRNAEQENGGLSCA